MYKTFPLRILTPEKEFFTGPVDVVTITTMDGSYSFLADHSPLIITLEVGELMYRTEGKWRAAANSAGFAEVSNDGVIIYTQACEYPEEIDANRAEEARRRAEENLRQKQSLAEFQRQKAALARAMARLRAKSVQD